MSVRRVVGLLLGAALLIAVSTACSRPEVQPLVMGAAPWSNTETSRYAITNLNGDFAGTLQYQIQQADDGWIFRREISSSETQEVISVETDDGVFLPRSALLVRVYATGEERVNTTYAGGQVDMELTTVQNVTTNERNHIPSDARDQRTVLMLLRTLPLEKGYSARMNSFLPVANLLDRVTVNVLRREEITVPAGTFDTWLVELDTGDSETRAWIGVDAPYPLVKFTESRNGGLFELEAFEAR
ncbi:MAG: DUF3108 domain-containing protein [Caldilineaceae bacterium]|nr:DUF3108 domain-containing protein [Caldilineaceae bacterium]